MKAFLPVPLLFAALAVCESTYKPQKGDKVDVLYLKKYQTTEAYDPRVSVFTYGNAKATAYSGDDHVVKYLYLVPTLGADLSAGFAFPLNPSVDLSFLDPSFQGEHLVDVLALSDYRTWFAYLAHFWNPHLGFVTGKSAGFTREPSNSSSPWVKHSLLSAFVPPLKHDTLFHFVKARLPPHLVPNLLKVLPSHPFSLALDGKVSHVERVVPEVPEVPFVRSEPVLLSQKLLAGDLSDDDRVALVVPVSVDTTSVSGEPGHLRFLHLVPKLGSDLSGGLATPARDEPRVLASTLSDLSDEHLMEWVGFSDCETWFAAHLTFWNPSLGTTYRAVGYEYSAEDGLWKKKALLPFGHPHDSVPYFVKEHVGYEHLRTLLDHLPSHPVTHELLKVSL